MTTSLKLNAGVPIKLALTRKETATALGLSAVTVDRLTERGLLKPSRATRRPLYSISSIEQFLKDTTAAIPA
jgi:DNA-binding transcriptional MerR regulator